MIRDVASGAKTDRTQLCRLLDQLKDGGLVVMAYAARPAGPLIRVVTEGRVWAVARGQRMGRPPKLTPVQQAEARRRRAQGATRAELARSYGVGKSTISRLTAG